MAIEIIEDLRHTQSGIREDRNGVVYTRVFLVSGLTPGPLMWMQAKTASVGAQAIPQLDDQLAGAPFPLFVDEVYTQPFIKSPDTCYVFVVYRTISLDDVEGWIVRFNGTTRFVQTNFHADGRKILVNYTPSGGSALPAQVGLVTVPEAYGILTYDGLVSGNLSYLLNYVNKLNNAPIWGGQKLTWWCRDPSFSKKQYTGGARMVHLEFEYNENTHVKTAAYRLSTGIVPADIDNVDKYQSTGNGWTNVDYPKQISFSGLNLPSPF